MAASSFRLPNALNIEDGNIAENFKKWRREIEIYIEASGSSEKSEKNKTAIILHCAGPKVIEIYDQFTWDNIDDRENSSKVLEKIKDYCTLGKVRF